MILELDCGNTLIKWRLVDGASIQTGTAPDEAAMLEEVQAVLRGKIKGVRLVSVRQEAETAAICQALEGAFGQPCQVALPAVQLGGVQNGYEDYRALGMDRWLAVVGAYTLARKACLVIDLGTAITADFVSSGGHYLGGFICPGLPLMRKELKEHTARIRYTHSEPLDEAMVRMPGRRTSEAVERGCFWMVRGFVREQCELAAQLLEPDYEVFLTGGDAYMVRDVAITGRLVPDLVFAGLAVACPLG